MALELSAEERLLASGDGDHGPAMAMRIVAETARLLGAPRLIPIASAHIEGALYHGDSGTLFAEKLAAGGSRSREQPVRSSAPTFSVARTATRAPPAASYSANSVPESPW